MCAGFRGGLAAREPGAFGVDFDKLVDDNKEHGGDAQEDSKPVQVVVGDHVGGEWMAGGLSIE